MSGKVYIERRNSKKKKKNTFSLFIKIFIIFLLFEIFLSSDWYELKYYNGNSDEIATEKTDSKLVEDIGGKIVRFHVIANSDDASDQALKLKVKDSVLDYVQPLLQDVKSKQEAYEILNSNDATIKNIAKQVIEKKGYKYDVSIASGKETFPIKAYGDIILPAGTYDAYRVIIGSGQGQNWWCVMFPPLCFVDVTNNKVDTNKTNEMMRSVLTTNEYSAIINKIDPSKVKIRFKIIDAIKSVLTKA